MSQASLPTGVDLTRWALVTGAAMNFSLSVTGRHGWPQEIADVALYLSSPQASWINGADIRVDGGLTGALSVGVVDFPGWR